MRSPRLALALLPCVILLCCRQSPAPQTSDTGASQPPGAPRDWVLNPPVAEDEREAKCSRLLSTAPNVTEICCALGLADCLIGRTRYCTYPPAVCDLPSIGALNDLNVEVLIELEPELILISGSSHAQATRLARLDIAHESVPDVSLDDLFTGIERIGELTGRAETARRLTAGIRGDLETVTTRVAGGPRARVLLLIGTLPDPPAQVRAAGPGSFYDDLLRRAGHENAATPSGQAFPLLSLEFILTADPDVIVELISDEQDPRGNDDAARHVWAKIGPLTAVAKKRVHVLAGTQHFILGPRIAQTYEALCAAIAGGRDE